MPVLAHTMPVLAHNACACSHDACACSHNAAQSLVRERLRERIASVTAGKAELQILQSLIGGCCQRLRLAAVLLHLFAFPG